MKELKVFTTPLLFIIFNRPDITFKTFKSIRVLKPKYLYISGDGPRSNVLDDVKNCRDVRNIVSNIDWDCEVKYQFNARNLGCKIGVSKAINWFFNQVDKGIILEDDCVPNLTFFSFCKELLKRYEDDSRIMHIGGNNFHEGMQFGNSSYIFTRIPHIWGWATWRRAWRWYDVNMKDYPSEKGRRFLDPLFPYSLERSFWLDIFDKTYDGHIDTWDYQWTYAIFKRQGLCINPQQNLVSNIGYGDNSTHTKKLNQFSHMQTYTMKQFTAPLKITVNEAADHLTMQRNFGVQLPVLTRLGLALRKVFPS